MRQAARHQGFTLIEVSLAIVIGLIIVAGSVAIFQQSKISAQNSAAKEKLVALSMLVEEVEARNFAFPTLSQLRTFWSTRRPDDYDKSPWGGVLTDAASASILGNDLVIPGQEIGDGLAGTPFAGTSEADRGRIYYFRRDPNVAGRPYIWMDEFSVFGPDDPESIARVTSFAVAYLSPEGKQWYFVQGKEKTNTAGGPAVVEGQITN